MPTQEAHLTVLHKGEKKSVGFRCGLGLQAIAAKYALPIEFDCRKADCGICIVRNLGPGVPGEPFLSEPTSIETEFLKAMRALPNERLACQTRVLGSGTIEVETF